jgi:hypothetical protein
VSTTVMAACSPLDSQNLSLPTASPTHIRVIDPHLGEGLYMMTLWGIPVVLSDDFVPG